MVADPRGIWCWEKQDDPAITQEKERDEPTISKWSAMMQHQISLLDEDSLNLLVRVALQDIESPQEIERIVTKGDRERDKWPLVLSRLRKPIQKELIKRFFAEETVHLQLYDQGLALFSKYREFNIEANQLSFVEKSQQDELTDKDYATLFKAYRYEGISLTFTPYKELGLSYKNLHT